MATTFVNPLLQLENYVSSAKLSGAKIYTYEAGTETPLATYQDVAGATANANPVVLDSAGMAQIRQTDGVAYKWKVYDSADNLLSTRDYITVGTAASAATYDYLSKINFGGVPGGSEWIGGDAFTESVLFPANFAGSRGKVETNPGASYAIDVKKNGSTVGTITIATNGTFTFATTAGATVSCAAGDELDFYGPASAGTAAGIKFTLTGTVQ